MTKLLTSKKTLVAAILVAVSIIAPEVYKDFDPDPETNTQWNIVIGAIFTLVMGLFARDNNISDEEAGIPPERTSVTHYYALHVDNENTENV